MEVKIQISPFSSHHHFCSLSSSLKKIRIIWTICSVYNTWYLWTLFLSQYCSASTNRFTTNYHPRLWLTWEGEELFFSASNIIGFLGLGTTLWGGERWGWPVCRCLSSCSSWSVTFLNCFLLYGKLSMQIPKLDGKFKSLKVYVYFLENSLFHRSLPSSVDNQQQPQLTHLLPCKRSQPQLPSASLEKKVALQPWQHQS